MSDALTTLEIGEDYPELRQSVRRICAGYPGAYWQRAGRGRGLSDRVRGRADKRRLPRRADPR